VRSAILAPGHNPILLERVDEFARLAFDLAASADETGMIDARVWSAFLSSGLAMAAFDERFGGAGLGEPEQQTTLCTILRLIGGADLSVARLIEGHVNAIILVSRYGSDSQILELAHNVQEGALTGVWGAEDADGLHRQPDGEVWSLRGRKILASGAGFIRHPLITVSTCDGPLMYLLDIKEGERADVTNWHPLGMRATASGNLDLTGLIVGPVEQIGAPSDYTRQPAFSGGAWRFCAAQLGAIERLLVLYAEQLRARGRDRDPYQLERLAQCAAACGSAIFWVEEAARRFSDDSLGPAAVVAFSNLTRMVTERAALDVLERVQRGVGLMAFMQTNPIERISRDLATYLRQPVPDMAMRDAASALLNGDLVLGGLQ
jgi:alkylation response protein AidB-like acyl-CoA dehydrogenase